MTRDEQRAVDTLERRANRAAAKMMDEHELGRLGLPYDLVVALLAVGWIEGRQDGGEEARELIRAEMARLTGGLHSVKS
jgi:hypothetical protein